MEVVSGVRQGTPSFHIKKVLKTYQQSAQRSLQGPRTVLGDQDKTLAPVASTSTAESPPPAPGSTFPVQSMPILTAPDQGRAERTDTFLEGESITCFVVGGEKRLCLPQVLNSVLRDFSLAQINAVCDDLHIYCSRCNPEQLEELQATGTLPATAASCGLITQTDAERLCAALLPRGQVQTKPPAFGPAFQVYHECFGKCRGVCRPEEGLARSIECLECRQLFSPQEFVSHAHRNTESSTVHWGFDSSNWRAYLLLVPDQAGKDEQEALQKLLERYKSRAAAKLKRKQMSTPPPSEPAEPTKPEKSEHDQIDFAEAAAAHLEFLKKARLDEVAAAAAPAAYLPYTDPYSYYWYESWACTMSAFRPWNSLLSTAKDGKTPPLPFLRDSLSGVPTYLSQGPPVLLHPERVVPMSEYERFERSFQPNVALAPIIAQAQDRQEKSPQLDLPARSDDGPAEKRLRTKSPSPTRSPARSPVAVSTITINPTPVSRSQSRSPSPVPAVDRPLASPAPRPSTPVTPSSTTPTSTVTTASIPVVQRNPDIELSTDTEDSASESTADSGVDNSVAAALESLSCDEKDARMAGVLRTLAKRLGAVEAERGRLGAENEALKRRALEQEAIILQQERVIQRLQEQQDRLSSKHDPDAFQDKVMAMEKELRTLRSEVSRLPNGCCESAEKREPEELSEDNTVEKKLNKGAEDSVKTVDRANATISVIHKTESLSGSE